MLDVSVMAALKQRVAELAVVVPTGAAVTYLDYAVANNVGDVLIMLGTDAFFTANSNRIAVAGNADNGLRRLAATQQRELIVLQGGGNLGDLYPGHERFRQAVIAARQHNPIVILPQTVHFESRAALARASRIYRAHPDLVICVRDRESEHVAREHLADRVLLAPDMAHYLWPVPPQQAGQEALTLLRTDGEAVAGSTRGVDWNAALTPVTKIAIKCINRLHRIDGTVRTGLPLYDLNRTLALRIMAEAVEFFSPYGVVTTSRLHAHILACLMGKEVTLLDNSYGKNRSYFEAWTRDAGVRMLTRPY